MSGRIDKSSGAPHDSTVYRVSQPTPGQQEKNGSTQQEAKSSYSFRDSRHVVKGGIAAVSLELAVEEETAENVELLGFQQGDTLHLDGMGSVDGTAFILELTKDTLVLQIKLTVPQVARRAAFIVFERLAKHPCQLDDDGQASLTACIAKDGKGGYKYSLTDSNNKEMLLMADHLDLRIDNFSARNILHQVQTFIVESGNNITFAIEQEPAKDPKGKIKVSLAPGIGDFDVTRQETL
ncbi:MAG: hypothetical protein ACAI44_37515 [Candidatus Sericytochromatia bacterium]